MKGLKTGCGGRVGKEILKFFLENKIYTYANYNRGKIPNKKISKFFIPYRQNIISKNFYIPNDAEALVHLASLTSKKNNFLTYKSNILMNKHIFKLIKKNKKIKKVIFFSTVSIYDKKNIGLINEKVKFLNDNYYAISKYKSEKIFNQLKKIKIYNLRIPGVLGTKQEESFISKLIFKMKKNETIRLFNPKNKFNNAILIDCLNVFILNLLKNNFKSGSILMGSSAPLKLEKIVNILRDLLKSKSKIIWSYKKEGFYLNVSKAQNKYKFKPTKTSDTIKKYIINKCLV